MSKIIATGITAMGIAIALLLTDLGTVDVLLKALGPLLLIFFPDLGGWLVISRYTYEPAPDKLFIVLGWILLLFFLLYVSVELFSR